MLQGKGHVRAQVYAAGANCVFNGRKDITRPNDAMQVSKTVVAPSAGVACVCVLSAAPNNATSDCVWKTSTVMVLSSTDASCVCVPTAAPNNAMSAWCGR
eukprot:1158286-Pelagomonas_calceolata.AAC.1